MKRLIMLTGVIMLIFFTSGCARQGAEEAPQSGLLPDGTESISESAYPDTWYDFSNQEPLADDSGDAESFDIKKVFAANDENYIYAAFEVEGDDMDSTTMINGGECIFVTVDMPGFFLVNNVNGKVFADGEGNGEYSGDAGYKYEDGMLQIRVPLEVFKGSPEFIINSVFRENIDGSKSDADKCGDFKYSRMD